MKYILYLIGFFTFSGAYAQNFSLEFGKISQAELDLPHYAQDKSAEAVVLYDIGKSYFEVNPQGSLQLVFERRTRIKIFTEAGIDWATVEIPLYHENREFEKVYDIEACTYNYQGGQMNKTKLNNSNIFEEKANENWTLKKFTMPDVKPGSIIEFRYQVRSPYASNLNDWHFQASIPIVHSEYEVRMIPYYEFTWLQQGVDKFDFQLSYKDQGVQRSWGGIKFSDMVHRYMMKDVPAFKDEAFITSANDYIIKLDFQLSKIYYPKIVHSEIPKGMNLSGAQKTVDRQEADSTIYLTTWPDLIKKLHNQEEFGDYIRKSEKLAEEIFGVNAFAGKTDKEKFNMVINYVKKNFNWNKSKTYRAYKTPGAFLKEKYGNSAEINLFATGLLNAAGIEAYPVIISTRDHGKIVYDYPYSHFFNYILIAAYFDDQIILSDATEPLIPNNRIPSRCFNDKGLVINKEKVEWIDFYCSFTSEKVTNISINVLESRANAKIKTHATEYDALYFRKTFEMDAKKVKDRLVEKGYEVADSSITIKNHMNVTDPYILSYNVLDDVEQVNNKIYVSPFLKEPLSENPLNQPTRTYPIDMIYPEKRTFNSWITIPEGYKVDYVAKDYNVNNELFEMNYSIKTDEKRVSISFNYSFKHAVYASDTYEQIKSFFDEIVKRGSEKVVFAKSLD